MLLFKVQISCKHNETIVSERNSKKYLSETLLKCLCSYFMYPLLFDSKLSHSIEVYDLCSPQTKHMFLHK